MKRVSMLVWMALIGVCGSPVVAVAQGLNTPNPNLPPAGEYLTAEDVHARYTGPDLEIVLNDVVHRPIADRAERFDDGAGNEIEVFDSLLSGLADVTLGTDVFIGVPFTANGQVQTIVLGKSGNVTGTFDTEMLAMNLSGGSALGPAMIRESPTRASLGRTTITDLGGGLYHIDSFFDVFTELSLDGGQNWIPSQGSVRVTLVPEPATLSLLALAGAALARRRRA